MDPVLAIAAPLALAVSAPGPCLVVDLDSSRPFLHTTRTLRTLADGGPELVEVRPRPDSVAVLANGGVDEEEASDALAALSGAWPYMVTRAPDDYGRTKSKRLVPLLPASVRVEDSRADIWQATQFLASPPGGGPTLPVPSNSVIGALLRGARPGRSRWVTAMSSLWNRQ